MLSERLIQRIVGGRPLSIFVAVCVFLCSSSRLYFGGCVFGGIFLGTSFGVGRGDMESEKQKVCA